MPSPISFLISKFSYWGFELRYYLILNLFGIVVKIAGTVLKKLAVTFKSHTTMIKLALTLSILDFFLL